MPKGGHTRSGPAPDPSAQVRERDEGEWVVLPREGRKGKAPRWPLDGGMTPREKSLWKRMWQKPQAVMWERLSLIEEVATYVRRFTEAEQRGAPVAVGTLVRQMSDSLGLTTPGLRMNRWKIEAQLEREAEVVSTAPSMRDRLKVVGDGGA